MRNGRVRPSDRKQDMVLAVVLGAASGVLAFLPLYGGLRLTRQVTETSNLGHMGALLLGVLVSFLVLAGTAIACIVAARDLAFPFVLAEAIALCVAAIVFGVWKQLRK